MSKSIKDHVLAIAYERDEKRKAEKEKCLTKCAKEIQNDVLDIIQEHFNDRVKNFNPWPENGRKFCKLSEFFPSSKFDLEVLKKALTNLGFTVSSPDDSYQIYISIPALGKGCEPSIAQQLLTESNIQIDKLLEPIEQEAKNLCKEVFQKLKDEDFSSTVNKYFVEVSVKVQLNCKFNHSILTKMVERYMSVECFDLDKIDFKNNCIILRLNEH